MLRYGFSKIWLVALVVVAGCGGGEEKEEKDAKVDDKPSLSDGHAALDGFLGNIADLLVPDAKSKAEVKCEGESCPKDGVEGDSYCSYKRYAETVQFDKFVAFQPNSASLWPGLVVRGEDAQTGLLTPVGVKLAPVTFSFSLENLTNSPVGHMDEPSLSAFREARNDILAGGVTGATAAALDFNITEVHSQSQIATVLGAGVNWPGGPEIASSFNFSSQDKQTKILVNFTQAYYTVDVDSPTTPKDFFDPSVTVEQLQPYVDQASPPLYLQSITYGRRVLFSIESSESAESIKAALEATYKVAAVDVNAMVSTEHQQALKSSSIKAFVIGGAGSEATGVISGFEGLLSYIKSGGNYSKDSPGAPIAYKLAYLDNAATKLAFSTEYSERTCTKSKGKVHAELVSLNHISGSDPGGNIEFYGQVTLRVPTVTSGVVSCSSGGAKVDLWHLPDGQWQNVAEFMSWKPESKVFVDINDVAMGPGKALCLRAELFEEDGSTGELTGDDYFGVEERLVLFENNWAGDHTLHLHGEGQNAVDVALRLTIE